MLRCYQPASESAGSSCAVVALNGPAPHPDPVHAGKRGLRDEGIKGVTDEWAEEGTRGTSWKHGLHADMPGKAGAAHVRPDARPGNPLLSLSAWRAREGHCAYLYLYVQICIAIRSEFPVRNRPSKGWREPLFETLAKTLQRHETHA